MAGHAEERGRMKLKTGDGKAGFRKHDSGMRCRKEDKKA
jgi:hypothetical protein